MLPDQMDLLGAAALTFPLCSIQVFSTSSFSKSSCAITKSPVYIFFSKMFFHGSSFRFTTLKILKSEGFMPFLTSLHSKRRRNRGFRRRAQTVRNNHRAHGGVLQVISEDFAWFFCVFEFGNDYFVFLRQFDSDFMHKSPCFLEVMLGNNRDDDV